MPSPYMQQYCSHGSMARSPEQMMYGQSPSQHQQQPLSQLLRHSKTDPSLSSNLAQFVPGNEVPFKVSKHFGSSRTVNQMSQQQQQQYPGHYHSGQHYQMYGGQMASAGPSNYGMPGAAEANMYATNNKLVHRHHFPNSGVHPYLMQHMCSCPTGSQIISPTSPTSSSFRNRMYGHFPKDQNITFEAPELSEETLLDKVHNETLAKLNFILALVDSIFELINSISSPMSVLSESIANEVRHRRSAFC